jgi:hypothetical protein
MDNLSLEQDINEQDIHAQDIHLCSVLRTSSPCTRHSFMFCSKDKLSMHKTFIYVLSEGQVLHAQGIHLCPVPKDKLSMHKTFIYVLFEGQLDIRTGHK